MRRVVVPLLVLGLAFFVTAAARAEDDAKTILEKAIKAHGGAEALTKYKGARMKATVKVDELGGIESIVNGDKFVFKINGMEFKLDNIKDSLKEAGHMIEVLHLVPLRDKSYELSVVGDVQVQGKPAIAVRVSKKDCRDITICFDKETYLTVKTERRATEPMSGMEYVEERILLEYQKIDGMPAPKKIVVNRDGKKYVEGEVIEMKFLESIDASEFPVP
jgi:hypothetical protein